MGGYELAEARYENRTLSDDEMWSTFSNLFSSRSKNSSSYKFGLLKAIVDNLYNVDQNLTLTVAFIVVKNCQMMDRRYM